MWPQLGIGNETQKELLGYWDSCRAGKSMPSRADIDPIDIPHLLPHVGLIDVLGGGLRFRYRLIGTQMNKVFGSDLTGRYLDQSSGGDYRDYLDRLYKRCAQGPHIVYSEGELTYQDRTHLWIARLLLPLSRDGRRVDMMLFSSVFSPKRSGRAGKKPEAFVADAVVGVREIEHREADIA